MITQICDQPTKQSITYPTGAELKALEKLRKERIALQQHDQLKNYDITLYKQGNVIVKRVCDVWFNGNLDQVIDYHFGYLMRHSNGASNGMTLVARRK